MKGKIFKILFLLSMSFCAYSQKNPILTVRNISSKYFFTIDNPNKDTLYTTDFESKYNYLALIKNDSTIIKLNIDEHSRKYLKILPFTKKTWIIDLNKLFQTYGIKESGEYNMKWVFDKTISKYFDFKYLKKNNLNPKILLNLLLENKTLNFHIVNRALFYKDTAKIRIQAPLLDEKNCLLIEDEEGKLYTIISKSLKFKRIESIDNKINLDKDNKIAINVNQGFAWDIEPSTIFETLKLPKNKNYLLVWKVDEYYSDSLEYEYK